MKAFTTSLFEKIQSRSFLGVLIGLLLYGTALASQCGDLNKTHQDALEAAQKLNAQYPAHSAIRQAKNNTSQLLNRIPKDAGTLLLSDLEPKFVKFCEDLDEATEEMKDSVQNVQLKEGSNSTQQQSIYKAMVMLGNLQSNVTPARNDGQKSFGEAVKRIDEFLKKNLSLIEQGAGQYKDIKTKKTALIQEAKAGRASLLQFAKKLLDIDAEQSQGFKRISEMQKTNLAHAKGLGMLDSDVALFSNQQAQNDRNAGLLDEALKKYQEVK